MRHNLEILPVLLLIAGPAWGTPVRIAVDLSGPAAPGDKAVGVLRIASLSAPERQIVETPIEAPAKLEVDLASGVAWEARFEAKGFWSETLTISEMRTDSEVRMRVFPSGLLKGRVVVPVGEKPLSALTVRFQAPFGPGIEKTPGITLSCPVKESALSCEVPAGRHDIRLRAENALAPVYRWDFAIPAGKTADLGEIALHRGASVSGWVQTEDGSPLSSECRLRLAPVSAASDQMAVTDQLEKAAMEAQPNDRGFFQFIGVPPGQYEITGLQPGFAPARIGPVRVRADLEAHVIERLILAKPLVVEIHLDPPLEPYGKPWKIELYRQSIPSHIASSESHFGEASSEGIWRSPGIPPGSYDLRIVGDLKSVWYRETLDIQPGQGPVHVDVPVLRVNGNLSIGKGPLSATLWLRGTDGRKIRFDSDERGSFTGVLPDEGTWHPQVVSEQERLQISLDPVKVTVPEGKRVAEVTIVVPDTRFAGQVVDDAGKPVPAARLTVVHLSKKQNRQSQLAADERGEFSARGLPPGSVMVLAMEGDRQSDFISAQIIEGGESPWLRIALRRMRMVEGRILSTSGGVPGALVEAWTAFDSNGASTSAQAVSGPDGSFELQLPADTTVLTLAVLPPGFAMRLLTILAVPGQPLEVRVETQGGTLVLEREEGPTPLLVHGGTFTLLRHLETWAQLQGIRPTDPRRLTVPNVESGLYSLCRGLAAVSRLREEAEPPAADCASGVLVPNGELSLRVPSTASKPAL